MHPPIRQINFSVSIHVLNMVYTCIYMYMSTHRCEHFCEWRLSMTLYIHVHVYTMYITVMAIWPEATSLRHHLHAHIHPHFIRVFLLCVWVRMQGPTVVSRVKRVTLTCFAKSFLFSRNHSSLLRKPGSFSMTSCSRTKHAYRGMSPTMERIRMGNVFPSGRLGREGTGYSTRCVCVI